MPLLSLHCSPGLLHSFIPHCLIQRATRKGAYLTERSHLRSFFAMPLSYSMRALQYRPSSLVIAWPKYTFVRPSKKNPIPRTPRYSRISFTSLRSMAPEAFPILCSFTVRMQAPVHFDEIELMWRLGLFCYFAGIWSLIMQLLTFAILQEPDQVRIPVACLSGFAVLPMVVFIMPSRPLGPCHKGGNMIMNSSITLAEDGLSRSGQGALMDLTSSAHRDPGIIN